MADTDRAAMTPTQFKGWLKDRNLTPRQVADHLGMGVRTVECWANGTHALKPLHVFALRGLDDALGFQHLWPENASAPTSPVKARRILDYLKRPGITQQMAADRFRVSRGTVARLVKKANGEPEEAPAPRAPHQPPPPFDADQGA